MDIHVLPRSGKWAVHKERAGSDISVHDRKQDAVDAARKIAQMDNLELVIHASDGTIREKDSHGHDPFPPRG